MSNWDDFIEGLNESPESIPTKKGNEQRFPCGQCHGTGIYQGPRVHQEKKHCFACRGKGYFKTDPRKLQERRIAARKAKLEAKEALWSSFREAEPEMFEELRNAHALGCSNDFINSLASRLFKGGLALTERQIAAWHRGKEKLEQIRAQRAEEEKRREAEIDLSPVRGMFETAVENGYKKPAYRAEGLVINRAPDHGSNPGALYVKNDDGDYLGKIIGTTFKPVRGGDVAVALLQKIAEDPLAAALRYGQRTGRCACCGRELTNHGSIEAGIGPVCREKWGF